MALAGKKKQNIRQVEAVALAALAVAATAAADNTAVVAVEVLDAVDECFEHSVPKIAVVGAAIEVAGMLGVVLTGGLGSESHTIQQTEADNVHYTY